MPDVSLVIGTVSSRDPKWEYTMSLTRMLSNLTTATRTLPEKYRFAYEIELNYATDIARNRIVRRAQRMGATHLLFLDDDMDFPPETAAILLNRQLPIVAANYTTRTKSALPAASSNGTRIHSHGRSGIETCDIAPAGVMLIEMAVFEKIETPYFLSQIDPGDPDSQISDDAYFCKKAKSAGFEIVIDHDLSNKIGHVGSYRYTHIPKPDFSRVK